MESSSLYEKGLDQDSIEELNHTVCGGDVDQRW